MVDKNMIDNIDLKFVRQDHYTSGGLDTMQLIDAKFPEEYFMGLVIGDVVRYLMRYMVDKNLDDPEKALTMLAWGVKRLRDAQ